MKKIVLVFGLIAGLIVVVMMFITMPFMKDGDESGYGQLIGYTTMVIALSSIFFAVKAYRDKHLEGHINFGKAFLIGIYISLIASFMYACGWELFLKTSGMNLADFMESFTKPQIEAMRNNGATEQEIADMMVKIKSEMEWYYNPIMRFLFTMFGEMFPVGLLISLISAAILKKKAKPSTVNA